MVSSILAMAAAATAASTDPLSALMTANGGVACYQRKYDDAWLKAHAGQRVREATFALRSSKKSGRPMMRMMVAGADKPLYLYGECGWYAEGLNRGVQNDILDESFKPTVGVGCHLYTDIDGNHAEEGGDFPVEWVGDGQTIQVHLPDSLAGWRSIDTSKYATFHELRAQDRIIRLNRVEAGRCKGLLDTFAKGAEMDDI